MNVIERIKSKEIFLRCFNEREDKPPTVNYEASQELMALAEAGLAAQWIPISERLPDDWMEVFIVFINHAGKHTSESTFKNGAFYYVAETNKGYYEEVFSCVTHWMPLPSAPK